MLLQSCAGVEDAQLLEHHRVDFVYLFLQVIFMSGFAMRLAMWIYF